MRFTLTPAAAVFDVAVDTSVELPRSANLDQNESWER